MSDKRSPTRTAKRFLALQLDAQQGRAPWPPTAVVLTSLRDQFEGDRHAWLELHPADLTKTTLFALVLSAATLWRQALDLGGDGVAEGEMYEKMLESLRRSLP